MRNPRSEQSPFVYQYLLWLTIFLIGRVVMLFILPRWPEQFIEFLGLVLPFPLLFALIMTQLTRFR